MYYVYLLRSKKDPFHKYIGFTEDLRTRVADHNEGKNPSTSPFRPWHLQTYLAFSLKKQALSFEKHIKSVRAMRLPGEDCGKQNRMSGMKRNATAFPITKDRAHCFCAP
jgi:putative endonuclease